MASSATPMGVLAVPAQRVRAVAVAMPTKLGAQPRPTDRPAPSGRMSARGDLHIEGRPSSWRFAAPGYPPTFSASGLAPLAYQCTGMDLKLILHMIYNSKVSRLTPDRKADRM